MCTHGLELEDSSEKKRVLLPKSTATRIIDKIEMMGIVKD